MAREYARIRLSIADDEEFENLLPESQWLYLRVLLPEPSLNYAGICDWRPNRLLGKASRLDLPYILTSAAELEERQYVLFDTATEEALIRTYIRGDELLRNPKMAAAVVSGYQSTASKTLRAFIVSEIQKAKEEHPEYSSWTHPISQEDLARLLTKKDASSVEYTNQIVVPITNRITNPDPGEDYQSDSVQIPCHLTPNTFHQSPSTYDDSPNEVTHEAVVIEPAFIETGSRPAKVHPGSGSKAVVRQVLGSAGYPRTIQERLAVQVERLLREGQPDTLVRDALAEWDRRPNCSKPEFLPTVLGDLVKSSRAAPPTSKLRDIVEMAREERAIENAQLENIPKEIA